MILKFGVEQCPEVIIEKLGSKLSNDLIGCEHTDKGIYIQFRNEQPAGDHVATLLGVPNFHVQRMGTNIYFILN